MASVQRWANERAADIKLPPQNLSAERSVLGAMLLDPSEVVDRVRTELQPGMFYAAAHGVIFGLILEMFDASKKVDLVTLAEELERAGSLADCGGAEYLLQIAETVPHTAHCVEYAKIVGKHHQRRVAQQVSQRLAGRMFEDGGEEATEAIGETIDSLTDLLAMSIGVDSDPFDKIVLDTLEEINARSNRGGGLAGIPWGIRDLDSLTMGLGKGHLAVCAARPGMGKTAWMLHTAMTNAAEGRVVLLVSLEMPKLELAERMLSRDSRIPLRGLKTGGLSEGERADLCGCAAGLSKLPLYVEDSPNKTVDDVATMARRARKKSGGKLDLIMVDYLQLLRPTRGKKFGNRQEEVGEISRRLKEVAKTLNVPVVALSQLNRGVESREDKRPRMSDLRESGAIEQDADQIVFLYRPYAYEQEKNPNYCELIVGKNRHGQQGTAKSFVRLDICTFNNASGDMDENTIRGSDNADNPVLDRYDNPFPE